ncbi:MAG: hypothetical protein U0R27_11780 [Candidatus Nanopelagicales bacterium]|jgi:hypothetical protein|nr:hypothetical protein [Actinomycetota bacterium]HNL50731.1 hypothetical protein [Actinomycetota bacterium]HNO14866.1 hypothetical protein [Actinomycetota bacterium]HUM86047.1 hypothetical protein [Actinomycetota bacterium]
MKKLLAIISATGIAATGVVVAAPAAQAKTVKACVKKSDGTVRLINKKNKKCKKGWVKSSWNSEGPTGPLGPQGPIGPAGPNWTVRDSSGQTLGTFGGFQYAGALLSFIHVVLDDGGMFTYYNFGLLVADNSALFENNGCTQAAVFSTTNAGLDPYLKLAGGSARTVFQVANAPTASAWKVAETTTTTVPVAPNSLFQKNVSTGVCSAASHGGGFILRLTPAEAPKVANGGLRLVR